MEDTLVSKKPMWRDILEIFVTAFAIYFIINIFFITSTVNQSSMYPTFKDGDFIIATRSYLSGNTFERGDVILFENNDGKVLIKRIVGLPGDKLEIKDGLVYINSRQLKEEYLVDKEYTRPDSELVIHDNCYFVLGDNRGNSIDSRALGEIKGEQIIGKVKLRLFPDTSLF